MNVTTTTAVERTFIVHGDVQFEEGDESVGFSGSYFADSIWAEDAETLQRIKLTPEEIEECSEILCTTAREAKRSGRESDEVEAGLDRLAGGGRG